MHAHLSIGCLLLEALDQWIFLAASFFIGQGEEESRSLFVLLGEWLYGGLVESDIILCFLKVLMQYHFK